MAQFQKTGMQYGFGSSFTKLGKKLLTIYGAIYIVELLCEHWLNISLVSFLQIYPIQYDRFRIWQILTHPFIHHPANPFPFLINCLLFYFFSGPVEYAFGQKRFLILFYFSALGGAVCGLIFGGVSGFNAPFMGMLPSLLSLVVIFGLLNPNATILLMFILPIKAKYLSYGTILITTLTFLAKFNPHGAYHLGGILFGYVYFKGYLYRLDPKLLYLRFLQWKLKKKKSRFRVIDGKKNDEDPPTYH